MRKEVQIIVSGKDAVSPSLRNITKNVEQTKREFLDMNNILKGAFSFGLGMAGFHGVNSLLKEAKNLIVDFNAELEQTRIGFTTMLGGATEANQFIKDIITLSSATPYSFDVITRMTQQMKALGWEAKNILPDLESIGNAVSALGGSTQVFERVVLAIGQMRTKGKVEAQELRQLAEAGIPAYEILAEKLGLTGEQVANIGEYAIDAKVAIDALLQGFNERFPDMMQKQADSYKGMMTTIKDNTRIILSELFSGQFDVIKGITKDVRDFTNMMRQELVEGPRGAITEAERLAESYERQAIQLDGLIEEYETLNSKTNKSQEEHDRLREVIDKIVQLAPQAVTGYDDMGRALLDNADAAKRVRDELWQLRKEQLEMAASRAKLEIPGLQEQISSLTPQYEQLKKQLDELAPEYFTAREWLVKLDVAITDEEKDKVIQDAIDAGVLKNDSVSTLLKTYSTLAQKYNKVHDEFIKVSEALSGAKEELYFLKESEAELQRWLAMKPEEVVKAKGAGVGGIKVPPVLDQGKTGKTPADVVDQLSKSLSVIAEKEKLLGDQFDEDAAKIAAYKNALEDMLALDPKHEKVKEWANIYLNLASAQELATEVGKMLAKAQQELTDWQNKDKSSALVLAETLRGMADNAGDSKDKLLELAASLEEIDQKIKGAKDAAELKTKTDGLLKKAESEVNAWLNRNVSSYELLARQLEEQAKLDELNADKLNKLAGALRMVNDEQKRLNDLQKLYDEAVDFNERLADDLTQALTGDLSGVFEDYGRQAAESFSRTFINEIRKVTFDKDKLDLSITIDTSIQNLIKALEKGLKELGKDLVGAISLGAQLGGGGTGASIGSTLGSAVGSAFGPVGTALGSIFGGLFGGLFDGTGKPSKAVTTGLKNLKKEINEFYAGGERYYKNWWDKLWGIDSRDLAKTLYDLGQAFGTSVDDISSALASAFSADTYEEFVAGFSQSIEEMTHDALVKAFMAQSLYPLIEDLYEEITKAAVDGVISPEERARIIALQTGITEQSEDFFNVLKDLGLAVGDVTDNMKALSGAMRNVPQGFKYALEAFRAIEPNIPPVQTPSKKNFEFSKGASNQIIIQGDVYGYEDFARKVNEATAQNRRTNSLTSHGLGGGY